MIAVLLAAQLSAAPPTVLLPICGDDGRNQGAESAALAAVRQQENVLSAEEAMLLHDELSVPSACPLRVSAWRSGAREAGLEHLLLGRTFVAKDGSSQVEITRINLSQSRIANRTRVSLPQPVGSVAKDKGSKEELALVPPKTSNRARNNDQQRHPRTWSGLTDAISAREKALKSCAAQVLPSAVRHVPLTAKLAIDPDGRVKEVRVQLSADIPDLAKCVRKTLAGLRFTPTPKRTELTLPLGLDI